MGLIAYRSKWGNYFIAFGQQEEASKPSPRPRHRPLHSRAEPSKLACLRIRLSLSRADSKKFKFHRQPAHLTTKPPTQPLLQHTHTPQCPANNTNPPRLAPAKPISAAPAAAPQAPSTQASRPRAAASKTRRARYTTCAATATTRSH